MYVFFVASRGSSLILKIYYIKINFNFNLKNYKINKITLHNIIIFLRFKIKIILLNEEAIILTKCSLVIPY